MDRIIAANPAAEAFFGYASADLLLRKPADVLDGASVAAFVEAEGHRRKALDSLATTITQRNGSTHGVHLKARRSPTNAHWHCRFIEPESRGLGAQLRRQNWALSAYARSSSALTRASGAPELTARICEAIVEQPVYVLACVGLLREDGWLDFLASSGSAIGYLDGLALSASMDVPEGRGPSGHTLRSGVPCLVRDTSTDPLYAKWREKGLRFGLRSTVTVAIRKTGVIIGSLIVYACEPNAFGPKELNLFCQLADEIAFAISNEEERLRLEKLEQARKQAEEKARQTQAELLRVSRISFMGEFAAALAHEINQPIAACELNAEAAQRWLARDPAEIGEARAALTRIVRDARRANEVIKKTRAIYVSGDSGFARFDLNNAVREVLQLTADRRSKADVTLHFHAATLPPVWGDRVQVQQIVFNLVFNAIDALESVSDRPRHLRVTTDFFSPGEALLEVKDNGCGFQKGLEARIFDRFFTTKAGGSGLGLAISRRIAEAHGGRLWADSGDGAILRLTLPFAKEDD
ncbi:signal transduction histidine kinase [Rhodoblastus acidophilus]|uniref:ATP-binding protein n=1 Tax=Rhodoblastus acidophilus TaxID=1074 RepID=UPI002223FEC7|nr:ATP-binding protein [Rhodoblastus acidophilus]MCW2286799.1 signal transduction histidine kinase [Rhodoblastus acidophilus]MCW2335652.1 signal transduction histidine kinase [Rhodoblastus acidophilus]